jgi:uncharacterized protein DUF4261
MTQVAHPPEPARTLAVDLCYPEPPDIDARALTVRARTALPGTALVWSGPSNTLLRHDPPDPTSTGRPDPTEILGLPPDSRPLTVAAPAGHLVHAVWYTGSTAGVNGRDLSQSWSWPDAGATLDRCRYLVTVVQLIGRERQVGERVAAFRATLNAIITIARPLATWWPSSQQALPPGALVSHPLSGMVNVRLFRSVHDPDVTVTDTLGLHALGLPDIQCRSRGLDIDKLGDLLFELAEYLCRHGDVLRTGRPVPGLMANQEFVPRHGPATVAPVRPVVDLDPGPRYAG